jgi:phosphoserine phosphatase
MEKPRLVIFDVEGVLIPKHRYLFFGIGMTLGLSQFVKIVFYGLLYETGLISLKSTLKRVFRIFRGMKIEELVQIFRQIPLTPGVEEVFRELRSKGWKTALISSGLPTIVVKDLASTLRADYAFGFELEVEGGIFKGEIWGDVIERNGKLSVLEHILKVEGLDPKDCIIVADDRNNLPLFLPETLKIGYNSDFEIRMKADVLATGKLSEIMPFIRGEPARQEARLSRNKVLRKIIHASGFAVPIISSFVGVYPVAMSILVVTALYATSELARIEKKSMPIISEITRHAATQAELYEFATAPILFALGILLTLVLFPISASSAAIAAFAVGDSAASIFGALFGKKTYSFNKGKTLEGSAAGFVFAFLAAVLFVSPFKALIGAAVAMIIEGLPLPLDDNLAIPLLTGTALVLLG